MEHEFLVFPSRAAAESAMELAFLRRGHPERNEMEVEITPVLPEDSENPGSIPCEENDPAWKGDWCVFGTDEEGLAWAVTNEKLKDDDGDAEWVCIS